MKHPKSGARLDRLVRGLFAADRGSKLLWRGMECMRGSTVPSSNETSSLSKIGVTDPEAAPHKI